MSKIPIVSFFSGGGFLDLGFELEGFEIKWSNEISDNISKIYNKGMSTVLQKKVCISSNNSIETIDLDVLKESFSNKWLTTSTIWGIIGGPPCPDFSIGGNQLGENGSKGVLSGIYVDAIIKLQPTFFLFENVKGLVSTNKHKIFFDRLIKKLNDNGYYTEYKLLNALDYGVPQDRERVILIGFHESYKNKDDNFSIDWNIGRKFDDAKISFEWATKSKFGSSPNKPIDTPSELMVEQYILDIDDSIANQTEYFKPKSSKFSEIDEGDTNRKSFKRLHRYRYSPTVAYGNNEVHLHPIEARRLSVREALRIQTIPDSYIMPDDISLSQKFKVVGNGVPVLLARGVAKIVMNTIK